MGSANVRGRLHRARDAALALWLIGWGIFVAPACAPPPAVYVYDENGRLAAVIDSTAGAPTQNAAVYTYDAAGNLVSITRRNATAAADGSNTSIISFSPGCGGPGTTVTI